MVALAQSPVPTRRLLPLGTRCFTRHCLLADLVVSQLPLLQPIVARLTGRRVLAAAHQSPSGSSGPGGFSICTSVPLESTRSSIASL
jgi:hypothetical protein